MLSDELSHCNSRRSGLISSAKTSNKNPINSMEPSFVRFLLLLGAAVAAAAVVLDIWRWRLTVVIDHSTLREGSPILTVLLLLPNNKNSEVRSPLPPPSCEAQAVRCVYEHTHTRSSCMDRRRTTTTKSNAQHTNFKREAKIMSSTARKTPQPPYHRGTGNRLDWVAIAMT